MASPAKARIKFNLLSLNSIGLRHEIQKIPKVGKISRVKNHIKSAVGFPSRYFVASGLTIALNGERK